jgi:hypothetical protein
MYCDADFVDPVGPYAHAGVMGRVSADGNRPNTHPRQIFREVDRSQLSRMSQFTHQGIGALHCIASPISHMAYHLGIGIAIQNCDQNTRHPLSANNQFIGHVM